MWAGLGFTSSSPTPLIPLIRYNLYYIYFLIEMVLNNFGLKYMVLLYNQVSRTRVYACVCACACACARILICDYDYDKEEVKNENRQKLLI